MTRRTRGNSLPQMIADLAPYLLGWRGYFGFCQTPRVLTNLEAWIRRRLRAYLWRQWQNGPNRFNIRRLPRPSRDAPRAYLDGELCGVGPDGVTSFEPRARRGGEVSHLDRGHLLRQLVYESLREDKPAREVRREVLPRRRP